MICIFALCEQTGLGRGPYYEWSVGETVDGQCTIREAGISESAALTLCYSLKEKHAGQWRYILSPTPEEVLGFTGEAHRNVHYMWVTKAELDA